jgi:hypothetical protein
MQSIAPTRRSVTTSLRAADFGGSTPQNPAVDRRRATSTTTTTNATPVRGLARAPALRSRLCPTATRAEAEMAAAAFTVAARAARESQIPARLRPWLTAGRSKAARAAQAATIQGRRRRGQRCRPCPDRSDRQTPAGSSVMS